MKNTNRKHRTIIFVAAVLFLCGAGFSAFGQEKRVYKVSDRVECDTGGVGKFYPGTIIPFDKFDSPEAADYYHVRLDRYPDSDYKCSFKVLRPLIAATGDAPPTATETPKNQTANSGKYRVGQRVECDSAGIGKYEKGTVVAFDQFDAPDAAELYYRVRLDSLLNSRAVCRLERMRPLGDATGDVDPMSNAVKLRVGEDGTVFADRELSDCENLEQPKAQNGARSNAKSPISP